MVDNDHSHTASAPAIEWQTSLLPPAPAKEELQVWLLPNAPNAQPELLSAEELQRAERIRLDAARQRFLGLRTELRRILSGYLGLEPAALRLAIGPHGKPFLDHTDKPLEFNLTHAGSLALLAVSQRFPVGLDVEQLRMRNGMQAIAEKMFDPAEAAVMQALDEQHSVQHFVRTWTALEAGVKCTGQGLFGERRRKPEGMSYTHFIPADGYLACLATPTEAPVEVRWLRAA